MHPMVVGCMRHLRCADQPFRGDPRMVVTAGVAAMAVAVGSLARDRRSGGAACHERVAIYLEGAGLILAFGAAEGIDRLADHGFGETAVMQHLLPARTGSASAIQPVHRSMSRSASVAGGGRGRCRRIAALFNVSRPAVYRSLQRTTTLTASRRHPARTRRRRIRPAAHPEGRVTHRLLTSPAGCVVSYRRPREVGRWGCETDGARRLCAQGADVPRGGS
jgi:hypothetical protein